MRDCESLVGGFEIGRGEKTKEMREIRAESGLRRRLLELDEGGMRLLLD